MTTFDEYAHFYAKVEAETRATWNDFIESRERLDERLDANEITKDEHSRAMQQIEQEPLAHLHDLFVKRQYWSDRIQAAETDEERANLERASSANETHLLVMALLLRAPDATPATWTPTIPVNDD